jgi:hypothetical protein
MGNLFTVLTSPQQTFERIREEKGAGWVAVMVSLMVLGGLIVWLQLPSILSFTEATLHQQPNFDEKILSLAITAAEIGGFAGAILAPVLTMFLGGLLLMLVNLFVRGEGKYMQLSKVVLFSTVPGVIGGLLTGVLARLTGATSPYDVAINAGVFFTDKKGWGYALASLVDPFAIWGLVLLIIGTAVVARRSRGNVALWIIIGWLVIRIISVISLATQK